MPTLLQNLRAAKALLGDGALLDMRLDLTAPGGLDEALLVAGGCWDQTDQRFLDPISEREATSAVTIPMQESQAPFVNWGASWLSDFREGRQDTEYSRIRLVLLDGARRGGKTFGGIGLVIATCVDVPIARDGTPLIAWIVCKSFRERFQLEKWITNRIPVTSQGRPNKKAWAKHLGAPTHEFHFVHGPILRLLSADRDDATKQGRVDIALIDEPQKMGAAAVANVVQGAGDLGGLVMLTANPPGKNSRGAWMYDLMEAIEDRRIAAQQGRPMTPLAVKRFFVDASLNKAIEQQARTDAGEIVKIINPDQARGDVDASWEKPGEHATKGWSEAKHRVLHALPETNHRDFPDCTQTVLNERGIWGGWEVAAGADFQDKSWAIAGVLARCFGDPRDPIIWFCDEHYDNTDERGYLDSFSDRFAISRGYTRERVLWIGDASGSWQNASHSEGRTSFAIWRANHWTIIPPQDPKAEDDDLEDGEARARNPFVDDQLALWNELIRRDRVRIDPVRCEYLAECVAKAVTKRNRGRRGIVQNKWAHALSCALYLTWRIASKVQQYEPINPDDVRGVKNTWRSRY